MNSIYQKNISNKKGFSLVELIVAFAIFLIFVASTMDVFQSSSKNFDKSLDTDRAVFLAEEGMEILKNIRDKDFDNLLNGTHGLVFGVDGWVLQGSQETIDKFTRTITITDSDQNEKKAEVLITWKDQDGVDKNYTLNSYVTNWRIYTPSSGLTLKKIIINRYSAKVVGDFAPYTASITVGTSTQTFNFDHTTTTESPSGTYMFESLALNPGTYTVSEAQDPNYTTTFGDDCNASGQVTINSGDSKICTITNEENIQVITYTVTKLNNNHYSINGQPDPTLTLQPGKRYIFNVNSSLVDQFWIKFNRASKVTGTTNAYNTGVQNNGISVGQIIFDVDANTPVNDLYYISQSRSQMSGNINVAP